MTDNRFGVFVMVVVALLFLGGMWLLYRYRQNHEQAKNILQGAALLAAGLFFLYKASAGFFVSSLKLSLEVERTDAAVAGDHDLLALRVRIKGTEENAIDLKHIWIGLFECGTDCTTTRHVSTQEVPVQRLQMPDSGPLEWARIDKSRPFITLSTADESEFGALHSVSKKKAYLVQVVVDGQRRASLYTSQWRASIVSVPTSRTKSPRDKR